MVRAADQVTFGNMLLFVFLTCIPVLLFSQTNVTLDPQFDKELSSRSRFFPFKIHSRPRVALVLSGGGARGVAQVGVLKALERHKIPIDFISATSLGAIVGGLYASGYTTTEIESLALYTDWDEVLSLSAVTKRTDLVIDQKLAEDWSFLVVRFRGLDPVIPPAVSSGQRLTDWLNARALQSLYHPNPSFDDLKIPFRAVTTDLISGKRIIMKNGSLAEALRASATVPLLFTPLERDSMQLIDGGLVSNIPVDIAREAGYDIVIAVNSTSGLRSADELKAPWETADQIMGIMMQLSNRQQLELADIVITPEIGKHLSSDFTGLDSLVAEGERATEESIEEILRLYSQRQEDILQRMDIVQEVFDNGVFHVEGDSLPSPILQQLREEYKGGPVSAAQIRGQMREIYETGRFKNVHARLYSGVDTVRVVFQVENNPRLEDVVFAGCELIPADVIKEEFRPLLAEVLNPQTLAPTFERVLRLYRNRGYSLARIVRTNFDEATGVLGVDIDEGIIDRIEVRGTVRTGDNIVLKEFPLEPGDVFEIGKAERGITNINSTKLFEFVYLEISYEARRPVLTLRLSELPSQLVRLGIRTDDERNVQGTVDIRDENFGGTGSELGLTISGGGRNLDLAFEYKSKSLFNTFFTFNIGAFYSNINYYLYDDAPLMRPNRWERLRVGEYEDISYGGRIVLGSRLEKLGNATAELLVQRSRIKSLENATRLEENHRLVLLRFGSVIDSKDRYPFPTFGIGFKLSYEFAIQSLGSEVGYNGLKVMYESYSTWGQRHTFHPKLTFGFADKTMPLGQQFDLGGRESLYGVREADRRGRQLLVLNIEYRYLLPIRLLFDTYARFRYDLGFISSTPEEIKLSKFRHGVGTELALDTPIGQAAVGVGRSFFFSREFPDKPAQLGPILVYFIVGYEL